MSEFLGVRIRFRALEVTHHQGARKTGATLYLVGPRGDITTASCHVREWFA